MELLARVARPNDAAHSYSWAGARRLWAHCTPGSRHADDTRMLYDIDAQLCYQLFGVKLHESDPVIAGYQQLLERVATAQSQQELDGVAAALSVIARWCDEREAEFFTDVWERPLAQVAPGASDWSGVMADPRMRAQARQFISSGEGRRLRARRMVRALAHRAEKFPSDAKVTRLTGFLLKNFPTPFALFDDLVQRVTQGDMAEATARQKCGNWAWDFFIAFAASPTATVSGARFLLVTGETAIQRAAAKAGVPRSVISFEQYLARLAEPSAVG